MAGVGSGRGANWKVVGKMLIAWVITIPAAGAVSAILFYLTRLPTLLAWIAIGIVVVVFGAWAIYAMRNTIHAKDVEAEIPTVEELAAHIPVHLKLEGEGPVADDTPAPTALIEDLGHVADDLHIPVPNHEPSDTPPNPDGK